MKKLTVERFAKLVKIGTGVIVAAAATVFFCRSCVPLKDSAELNSVSNALTADTQRAASSFSESSSSPSTPNASNSSVEPSKAALININTATSEELQALSGIGEAKAAAIIAYREEHGAFNNISEIMNVSGIGEKIFENIRDSITTGDTSPSEGTSQSGGMGQPAPPETALVNINTATSKELQVLSGIGEAKAAAIIAYREEHGAFGDISEIMNVSGIGEKIFEGIRRQITV